MNVVAIEGYGGPEKAFKYREEPFPVPREDEVLIGVVATGVNELDIWRTRFKCKLPQHWNNLPGLECTGNIIGIGKDVQQWKIGDQVCALLNGGGYAQAVSVRATQVFPLPLDDISLMRRVACLPQAACTTWEAIIRLGKLSATMTLLVYQRCGKICDLAIQLAEMVQASVIIATDESTAVETNYSHVIVDCMSPHFTKDVLKATGNKGVDLILDRDISTIEKAAMLKSRGTLVLVDLEPEKMVKVNFLPFNSANGVLHVVDRMYWTPEYMDEVVSDMKENMWPAFSNGSLVLPDVPEEIYLLYEAAKAHKGSVLTPL